LKFFPESLFRDLDDGELAKHKSIHLQRRIAAGLATIYLSPANSDCRWRFSMRVHRGLATDRDGIGSAAFVWVRLCPQFHRRVPGEFDNAGRLRLNGWPCDRQNFFIALGNTLEALAGAWLVNRFGNGVRAFERAQTIFRFVALAAVGSTVISATCGVTTLCLSGAARWEQFWAIGLTWWLGDIVSDLIVAPLLVVWIRKAPPQAMESLWWRHNFGGGSPFSWLISVSWWKRSRAKHPSPRISCHTTVVVGSVPIWRTRRSHIRLHHVRVRSLGYTASIGSLCVTGSETRLCCIRKLSWGRSPSPRLFWRRSFLNGREPSSGSCSRSRQPGVG